MNQTYKNIEVIVSDDCSKDDTVSVVQDLVLHKKNDIPVRIVSTPHNSGICGNYNNALKYAKGKWIKYIAGDDVLQPECVSAFVEAAESCDDKIFICGTLPFTNDGNSLPPRLLPEGWFAGDARSQERLIIRKGTIIEGPTLFIERETLQALGGFDEKYPFIEDFPLCMKFLAHGFRIHLVSAHLVRYREYTGSVSHGGDDRFGKSIFDAIDDYAIPASFRNHMYIYAWHLLINKWIRQNVIKPHFAGYLLRVTDILAYRKHLS
jgi:glycosyltransferase involved in cell wall biosynthesis